MRFPAGTVWNARGFARRAAFILVLIACAAQATAQSASDTPRSPNPIALSGSLRSRIESSDWFGENPNGDYWFAGSLIRLSAARSTPRAEWQIEVAIPVLTGLPDRAIVPGAQGALGLGATYFAANGNRTNVASIFAKQAFLRLKRLGGVEGQSLKIGRMEFVEGAEVTPAQVTLAALKRDGVAHRLLGTFGFSHVGRSLDGVVYALDRRRVNVTALAARPTQGVFQVDGWGELNATVLYAAVTSRTAEPAQTAEWRLFGLGYIDSRSNVLKIDNRPLDLRQSDGESIEVGTLGGHYLRFMETAAGTIDLLAWLAFQNGSWGALGHRAGAVSGEIGWQPDVWPAASPWLRGGFTYGSGDSDPNDFVHGTFFQVLPTPRVYARFPFYNMMNERDAFIELRVKPHGALALRGDIHALRLSDAHDLWYQGGGAFQSSTIGYAGRPSGGQSGLATLYDLSGDVVVNRRVSIGAYISRASGQGVPDAIYGRGSSAQFGYVELLLRF